MATARDEDLFFIKPHKASCSCSNSVMSLKGVTYYPLLPSRWQKLIYLTLNV